METPTLTDNSTTGSIARSHRTKILPQVLAAFAGGISAFGMGTVEAYTSPALPSMQNSGTLGILSTAQQSNIASIALLAALLTGPQIGYLMGKIGRKSILIISALPFVTGWLLVAAASNLTMMYIGRFLTGFCAGTASLVVPIYIGEISQDSIRGMLCSGFQLMVTLGNFFVYFMGTFLDWQWLAFTCGMVPLLGLFLMAYCPASPTFLISRGREFEATAALMALRGAKSISQVELELNSIQSNLKACNEEKKSFKDIFKSRTIRPMLICLALLFFQQMTGIEAILVYTVYIFQACGVKLDPNHCTIIVGALQVIATFVSAILVDRAGRRILLIISLVGVSVSMLSLAVFLYFKNSYPVLEEDFNWIPLISLCVFIIFFAIGAGPVPFLMIAELNSIAVIGIASAAATTFNWTFAYLVTIFFMDIESKIGLQWCFLFFSVVSLLGVIFVFIFVPETKGISIEKIQNYFRKSLKIKGNSDDLDTISCKSSVLRSARF